MSDIDVSAVQQITTEGTPKGVTREGIEDAFAAALEVADSIEDFRQAARDRNAALAALETP